MNSDDYDLSIKHNTGDVLVGGGLVGFVGGLLFSLFLFVFDYLFDFTFLTWRKVLIISIIGIFIGLGFSLVSLAYHNRRRQERGYGN